MILLNFKRFASSRRLITSISFATSPKMFLKIIFRCPVAEQIRAKLEKII